MSQYVAALQSIPLKQKLDLIAERTIGSCQNRGPGTSIKYLVNESVSNVPLCFATEIGHVLLQKTSQDYSADKLVERWDGG